VVVAISKNREKGGCHPLVSGGWPRKEPSTRLFAYHHGILCRTQSSDDKRDDNGAPLMPQAPPRACRSGCPHFQPCPVHNRRQWARPPASSTARGYGAKHQGLRRQVLVEEPICRRCGFRPSTIADHIVPLSRGGRTVRKNLQGLFQECSGSKTGREGAQARAALPSGHLAGPKGDGAPVPSSRRLRDLLPLPPWGPR
jgi:5-methylcytosine-specific restriction enzyme A